MFSIIYEPVHGIIYKNSKKEKRMMRPSKIHKFCDATLNRILEGLKSYNNDVKYGYVQSELTNDEVEYVKLFEEEIEVSQPDEKMGDSNTTAKLPLLKLGEYEMWVMRIKQYFQVQDYALWDVIENGNSWVSVPQTTQENGALVTKMSVPVTAKEKTNKKNNYSDAKTMFAAIETRFRGNEATKKTQKALLKQQYENFNASSTESLDSIFNRLQKLNPNGSNLLHQDLEQIHEDDREAMDLKWQPSLLSMRAKRYYQRTGNFFFINANDTAGYDKSKVECFNCHKMGHFAREYRAPRNKEGQFRNQDNTRKQGNNEDTSSKAMLAIDGVGFDWSDMAEEQVQTNMALMAFSDSEVYNDKSCTKTYLKNYETLKKQCDDLIVKLNQTEFIATTYKRGLATVEEQLVTYRKNEVLFSEEVTVFKRDVACKDYEISVLKSEFEKVKQEKVGIEFKIKKFDNASKSLDKLLGSQITDKSKKGLGYNVVPPPHPLIYNGPTKLDLSYSGLDEFKEPEFKGYGPRDSKQESNINCDKKSDNSKGNTDDSLVKEQVSEDKTSSVESPLKIDKETGFHAAKKVEFVKPKKNEKPVRKSIRALTYNSHMRSREFAKQNSDIISGWGDASAWKLHWDIGLVTMVYGGYCNEAKMAGFRHCFYPTSMVSAEILGSIVFSEQLNLGSSLRLKICLRMLADFFNNTDVRVRCFFTTPVRAFAISPLELRGKSSSLSSSSMGHHRVQRETQAYYYMSILEETKRGKSVGGVEYQTDLLWDDHTIKKDGHGRVAKYGHGCVALNRISKREKVKYCRSKSSHFRELLQTCGVKFDMHAFTSSLTADEVNNIAREYGIPEDLRPRIPSSTLIMNNLPANSIVAHDMPQFLKFPMSSGVRVGRGTTLKEVVKHEDERVLATKRNTQAAKDRAANKRPAPGDPSRRVKKKKTAPISMALSESEADVSA
ncbi:ribonuclease H-like domain-containing protein [Tanacetum coccineum]|uniref:Ribonuclease H-like domain-containing protein n=1 Tax=Tanacetum coccineum TaxID=301880 RepID=A0ABQ5HRK2_9ASTR